MTLKIKSSDTGLRFSVTIQPRASRNEIQGLHNDSLKVKHTSPPVEGAANKSCLKFLAKTLGVSPSRIEIVSGAASRNKVIQVEGLSENEFREKLNPYIT